MALHPMAAPPRIVGLARTFPSLNRPGLPTKGTSTSDWNAPAFDAWACDAWATSGSTHAARFILNVWSGGSTDKFTGSGRRSATIKIAERPRWTSEELENERIIDCDAAFYMHGDDWRPLLMPRWDVGAFDVVDAFGSWDDAHRRAFVAWASAPWWP